MQHGTTTHLTGLQFEEAIGRRLRDQFPNCVLSNLLLFRPDVPHHREYGYEIDHLLHFREADVHQLFIIECKQPAITRNQDGWWIQRPGSPPRDARLQIWNHAISLLRHLEGVVPPSTLRVEACLLGGQEHGLHTESSSDGRVRLHCMGWDTLHHFLKEHGRDVQRVNQSLLLGELRLGLPIPELGHPDIANAIEFIAQCRRALDNELFRLFPKTANMTYAGHAAINGSAGMGKSVLLAYAMFVLSSDRMVVADAENGNRRLESFTTEAARLGVPTHQDRAICAVAMSVKQTQVLQSMWKYFVDSFSSLDGNTGLQFQHPVFKTWDDEDIDESCNILLIDEAHDLSPHAQKKISGWKNSDPTSRYLLIACDRHQKLRLVGADAPMLEGVTFSGHTVRLSRNYRSPFPVYAAGLALMFRWFAPRGPKVIPSSSDLRDGFGFKLAVEGDTLHFENINDSHPGNRWSYTVASFVSPSDVMAQVASQRLRRRDVLWVRFGEEDPRFDYETLGAFTYHAVGTTESPALLNKYVKGQEFPVVVIEGLPAAFDAQGDCASESSAISDLEKTMWEARRELYLCASRATAFLYFVGSPENPGIKAEFEELLRCLSSCQDPKTRKWKFDVATGTLKRTIKDIDKLLDPWDQSGTGTTTPRQAIDRFSIPENITLAEFIPLYGAHAGLAANVASLRVYEKLAEISQGSLWPSDKLPPSVIQELGYSLGFIAEVQTPTPPPLPNAPASVESASYPVTPRMSVEAAASVLGRPQKQLLEVLPVNYYRLSLLTDGDITLLKNHFPTATQRQTPQHLPPTPPSVDHAIQPVLAQNALERSLLEHVNGSNFRSMETAVSKYISILWRLIQLLPQAESILLAHRTGRGRGLFSRSESAIKVHAPYATVRRIGSSGVYAMCTLSNQDKAKVLSTVLRESGVGWQAIAGIVSTL